MKQYQIEEQIINRESIDVLKMQLDNQISENCPLCNQNCMHILISSALFNKHTSSHNFYYTKDLDDIVDQNLCVAVVKHKQTIALDQNQQFLRRFYKLEQYQNKNKAISQYYKFHHDYPKLHQLGIDKILQKYYDRKKEYDYKKIKKILKEEEDISITTQKSSSIVSVDQQQKKSKYSDILGDLDNQEDINDNQSQVLKKICDKIGKAYQKRSISPFLTKKRSLFYQNNFHEEIQSKKFNQYIKKQQAKLQKQKQFQQKKRQAQLSSSQKQKQSKKYSTTKTSAVSSIGSKKLKNTIKNALFYDGRPYVSGSQATLNTYHKFIPSYKNNQNEKNFNNQNFNDNINQNLQLQFQVNNHVSKISLNNQNPFKKSKEPNLNMYGPRLDNKTQQKKISIRKSQSRSNMNCKQKSRERTTQDIYKNAAQQLRNGKRSSSFNSLVHKQQSQRNSFSNLLIKQKSQFSSSKYLKQKNIITNNEYNMENYNENFNSKPFRAKSTNNLQRYHPHQFYQDQDQKRQIKKIKLTSSSLKNLKLKSSSNSKIYKNKAQIFNTISKQGGIGNLFTDAQIQNKNLGQKNIRSKQKLQQRQTRNIYAYHNDVNKDIRSDKNKKQSSQNQNVRSKINIDNLLQRKLLLQHTKGVAINKILI